jgi:hypothetical protein
VPREHSSTSEVIDMPVKVRSVLLWILVIFLVYAVVATPERAADVVQALWRFLGDAVAGFGRFFADLTA